MHFIARKKIPRDERGLLSSIVINVTENRDQVCATTYIAAADSGQALQPANAVTTAPQTLGVHESVLRGALRTRSYSDRQSYRAASVMRASARGVKMRHRALKLS